MRRNYSISILIASTPDNNHLQFLLIKCPITPSYTNWNECLNAPNFFQHVFQRSYLGFRKTDESFKGKIAT